jgi:SpoVK/Ycf46/Vps4 family AAA+-type ATPase
MTTITSTTDLFGQVAELPDQAFADRYDALVGLDDQKSRILGEAEVLLDPTRIKAWSAKHHGAVLDIATTLAERVPLIVLAGDVGTGKTELAETIGDRIGRQHRLDVTMYPLSLNARGKGLVGEMTSLITRAFDAVRDDFTASRESGTGRARRFGIIVIDEADALAQSREMKQMHHEDRAGVNALIRAVDGIRQSGMPVLTIMCTNRASAIDPAILRRAARVFTLERPDCDARAAVLRAALQGTKINENDIAAAAKLLGSNTKREWGATFSDLRQRLIPDLFMSAYAADEPVTGAHLVTSAAAFEPTRPFTSA